MDIIHNLIMLGLDDKEAKVYLAGVRLGTSPASTLAQASQVKRGTIYSILRQLKLKGLCQESLKKKKKTFTMSDPNALKVMQNERDNILSSVLPLLRNMASKDNAPQVRLFSGIDEVRKILEDMLNSKTEILEITSGKLITTLGWEWCIKYIDRRVTKKVTARSIVTGDKITKVFQHRGKQDLREMKFIQTKSEINMALETYDNKTALISLSDTPFGLIIEDDKICKSLRALFEVLWVTV